MRSSPSIPTNGYDAGAEAGAPASTSHPEGCTDDPQTCELSSFTDGVAYCLEGVCDFGKGKTYQ